MAFRVENLSEDCELVEAAESGIMLDREVHCREPHSDNANYALTIKPGEVRFVIYERGQHVGCSWDYTHYQVLTDDMLRAKCLAEGKKEEIDGSSEAYMLEHEHSAGVLLIYKNDSTDKGLRCELHLGGFSLKLVRPNIRAEMHGQDLGDGPAKIEVGPG